MRKPLWNLLLTIIVCEILLFVLETYFYNNWNSVVFQFHWSLITNIVAGVLVAWGFQLAYKDQEIDNSLPTHSDSRRPKLQPRWRNIAYLVILIFLTNLFTQALLDSLVLILHHALNEKMLTEEGLIRIGAYLIGHLFLATWLPFMAYASLSIGRRSRNAPKFFDFFISTLIGMGLILVLDFFKQPDSIVVKLVFYSPGNQMQFLSSNRGVFQHFDNMVGVLFQISVFLFFAVLHACWMKIWSLIGWTLKNKNII